MMLDLMLFLLLPAETSSYQFKLKKNRPIRMNSAH